MSGVNHYSRPPLLQYISFFLSIVGNEFASVASILIGLSCQFSALEGPVLLDPPGEGMRSLFYACICQIN